MNFLNFNSKKLNRFYLSFFIMTFGESLISIFIPIYLFSLGYQIHTILLFFFLNSLYFVIFSHLGAIITSKIGDRFSILLSTIFLIFYHLGLIFINSYHLLFFLLPLFLALRIIFFNFGYHFYFISHSNKSKIGQELAFFNIIILLATALAPYLGSILANINFSILFIFSSILIIFSTAPLFCTKKTSKSINYSTKILLQKINLKNNRNNFISFSGYAIESIIDRTLWPIFLILTIGTLIKTGALISISLFISLFSFYFIGQLTDKFNKLTIIKISTYMYFFSWIGRIFSHNQLSILIVESYKNLIEKFLHLPWSAHSYNLAKKENSFEFIVAREIIYNLARIIILPFLIIIFQINFYPFIISFLTASLFSLGYKQIEK